MNATRIKKAGKAVAGSALLVGATLTGAAGLAAASSHNSGSSGDTSGDMTLADYPTPFINENGEVNTAIVVGEQAATIDVVGAINIAGSLGNQAFTTEQVSTEGGNFGFTATQGVTLSTQNDNLYYGDSLTEVRDTLTEDDISVLQTVDFSDDSGDDTEIESFINIGDKEVQYGNQPDGVDDDEDPVLHIPVPSEGDVDEDDFLINMQANFEDGLDFTDEDVAGEDIQLFGTTYTVAEDNDVGDGEQREELILFGASETVSVSTGGEASTTSTIGGEEVTLGVDAVTDKDTAAITVNGELEEYDEDEEFTVNDETVRVDNIIQTNNDNSQGTVQFSIGSEELRFQDGEAVEDGDGDEIEGTHVEFNGAETNVDDIAQKNDGQAISSIDVYLGAQDDDNDFIASEEAFTHEFFDQASVRFGGLNPDAADSEGTTEISVETNGDTEAQISFTGDGGESVTQDFLHNTVEDGGDLDDTVLADSDNDQIATLEGQAVSEDGYFTTDAGDFSHLWELTSVDFDTDEEDESTVDITDVVTGESVEVELDDDQLGGTDDGKAGGKEIIDGQTYYFVYNNNEGNLYVTYGDGADFNDEGDRISVAAAVDTENGGAVSFFEPTDITADTDSIDVTASEFTDSFDATALGDNDFGAPDENIVVGGGDGPAVDQVTVSFSDNDDVVIEDGGSSDQDSTSGQITIQEGTGNVPGQPATVTDITVDEAQGSGDVDVADAGGSTDSGALTLTDVTRTLELPSTESTDEQTVTVDYTAVDADPSNLAAEPSSVGLDFELGTGGSSDNLQLAGADDPAAVFVQPENEDDAENAFILDPNSYDSDDGFSFSTDDARDYTGSNINVQPLEETDEDTDAGYNEYGTYVQQNTDDEGSVSLMLPTGQSVAGAAVTTGEGSLEMGSGAGSVESMSPTGFGQEALLDSEVTSSQRQNTNHILVGGPAVNDLVSTLVDQGEADVPRAGASPPSATSTDGNATDGNATEGTTETYGEGDAVIQLVEDSFADGANSLIVAGFTGDDTRRAADRLANADENPLPGRDRFSVGTGQ